MPSDAKGLLYDSTLCIGCRACVTKCKAANSDPADVREIGGAPYDAPEDLSATTRTIVKIWAEGDRTAFVKRQCMHCVDPACVSACMIKAYRKGPNGIISYEVDRCLGDRYCQIACPFNVPKFEWSKAVPKMVKCELCRHRKEGCACAEACPREAVISGKTEDLRKIAQARLAKSPDRYEPRVYGETEAGGTQCLYLAPKGVPFEKLGLPKLGPEAIPARSAGLQQTLYYGGILPAAAFVALGVAVSRNRKKGGEP